MSLLYSGSSELTIPQTPVLCNASYELTIPQTPVHCNASNEPTIPQTSVHCNASNEFTIPQTPVHCYASNELTIPQTPVRCHASNELTIPQTPVLCHALNELTIPQTPMHCHASNELTIPQTPVYCHASNNDRILCSGPTQRQCHNERRARLHGLESLSSNGGVKRSMAQCGLRGKQDWFPISPHTVHVQTADRISMARAGPNDPAHIQRNLFYTQPVGVAQPALRWLQLQL